MTFAWYGHVKNLAHWPLWLVIFFSWGIAFFEYCFQVPANRMGVQFFTLPQLKIIQEALSLFVFLVFSMAYLEIKPTWNYLWASLSIMAAVFFIFQDKGLSR